VGGNGCGIATDGSHDQRTSDREPRREERGLLGERELGTEGIRRAGESRRVTARK
jgi:hypothetical protein